MSEQSDAVDALAEIQLLPGNAWEYAHVYSDFDGTPQYSIVSQAKYEAHKPDGHIANGSPYWNYSQQRRQIGPWIEDTPAKGPVR